MINSICDSFSCPKYYRIGLQKLQNTSIWYDQKVNMLPKLGMMNTASLNSVSHLKRNLCESFEHKLNGYEIKRRRVEEKAQELREQHGEQYLKATIISGYKF